MSAPSEASSDEYDDDDDEEFTQTECLSLFEQCDSELFPEVRRRLVSPNITQHRKLKEIFSRKFGMTALHVSLYNRCPSDIVELIVRYAASDPRKRNLLAVKDDDYKNTPLHVAAQTGCSNDVLRFLVKTYPDALLSENDAKRTPLALIKRYFKSEFPAVPVLTKLTRSYTLYRTRLEVHLHLYRTFITKGTEVKAGCVKVRSFGSFYRKPLPQLHNSKSLTKIVMRLALLFCSVPKKVRSSPAHAWVLLGSGAVRQPIPHPFVRWWKIDEIQQDQTQNQDSYEY